MVPENEAAHGEAREPVAPDTAHARDEAAAPGVGESDAAEFDAAESEAAESAPVEADVTAPEMPEADGAALVADATIEAEPEMAVEAVTEAADEADAAGDQAEADEADQPVEALAAAEANPAADDAAGPEARPDELRLLEALLFAASEPVEEKALAKRMPSGADIHSGLKRLQLEYAPRGVNLVRLGTKWAFRTANDLAWLLTHEASEPKKLSRAAVETLAIIAYHQPVTRAEIEEIRGVAVAKGTIDVLLETGWIRPRGRRKAPGRPVTYGTTDQFLSHFGLEQLNDLPGLDELKGAGLFDGQLPSGFGVPNPSDDPALREDEDPLDAVELDLGLAPRVEEPPAGEAAPDAPPETPVREEGD
ncbi:segregation and condensation protein B [Rhodoplanes tepidamans]|nr:segregation and condensation protein B [Rhodoplanes tepidamans]